MNIDPKNILMILPKFIIMKDGTHINNVGVNMIEETKSCERCGKNKTEDDVFFGTICSGCSAATRRDTDKDFSLCQGSTMFRLAEWEPHIEDDDKGTLFLYLLNRNDLIYEDVPKNVWLKFISAKSMGKFYNSDIKGVFLQRIHETQNKNLVSV